MRYRLLGKSGLRVSQLCLGTMTFGEDWGWGSSKDESRQILDAFFEAGGNFIDTANVYTNGTSESLLGEFLMGDRDRAVLATKYTNAMLGTDPNAGGNQWKNMMRSVEASLKRLQTDYIDLYWLHIWDKITPLDEVMRAFDDLVRQGKILHAGVSDMAAWAVARASTLAELRGWTPFVGLQIEYSLIERTSRARTNPDGRGARAGSDGLVATGGGRVDGQVRRGQGGSQRPNEQRDDEGLQPGRRTCQESRERGPGCRPSCRPFAGPGCPCLASTAAGPHHPDRWGQKTGAVPGQPRLFGSATQHIAG